MLIAFSVFTHHNVTTRFVIEISDSTNRYKIKMDSSGKVLTNFKER